MATLACVSRYGGCLPCHQPLYILCVVTNLNGRTFNMRPVFLATKRANRVLWPQVIRLRLFNVHWQQETCWRTHTVAGEFAMRLVAYMYVLTDSRGAIASQTIPYRRQHIDLSLQVRCPALPILPLPKRKLDHSSRLSMAKFTPRDPNRSYQTTKAPQL